ncbi:MAG: hypothetical protein MGG11_00315 [Trichodesmium sp. MAG_R03]|nr:hypothetical protein [Trichodesmium sp. MAG_R03]
MNQPGLWWSDGEAYQAALQKSGKLLKEYVQKNHIENLFQGIAEKIVDDENWDEVAESLARKIFCLSRCIAEISRIIVD